MSLEDLADALVGCKCEGVESLDLEAFLSRLPVRYREVLCKRFGVGVECETLAEIASSFGVSREWSRLLEAKALIRMREMLYEKYYMIEHRRVFTRLPPSKRELAVAEVGRCVGTVTSEQAAYITGFFEGDGSIVELRPNYFQVAAYQVESAILEYIRTVVGGGTLYRIRSGHPVHWRLIYTSGVPRRVMFHVFSKHVVSSLFLVKLNKALRIEGISEAALHEPTIDWLAGFFDAEGCAFSSSKGYAYWLGVGQKERGVLGRIQAVFSGKLGKPRKDGVSVWSVYKRSEVLRLANDLWMRSHSPKKRADLEALMTRLRLDKSGKLLGSF